MTRRFSETVVIGILHHLEPDQIYALNPSKFLKIYPELHRLYLMGRILVETSYANNSIFCRYLENPYGTLECTKSTKSTKCTENKSDLLEHPDPLIYRSFLGDYTNIAHQDRTDKDHSKALKLHTISDVRTTLPEIFKQPLRETKYSYDTIISAPLGRSINFPINTLIMGCYLEADTFEHLQEFLENIESIRLAIGQYIFLSVNLSTFSNHHIKKITDTKISIFPEFLNGFPSIGWSYNNIMINSHTDLVKLNSHISWSYMYYDLPIITIDLLRGFNYERLIRQSNFHGHEKIVASKTKTQLYLNHCVSRIRIKFVNFECTTVPAVTLKSLQLNIDGRIYDYTNLLTMTDDDGYDLFNFQTQDLKHLKFINCSLIDLIELYFEIEGNLDDLYLAVTFDNWNLIQSIDGNWINIFC